MKGLILALQFMTRLPSPSLAVSKQDFANCIRWFPAVGLIIGAFLVAAAWAGLWISNWLAALAALILWVAISGALHLDGLGDIADASGAAHKEQDKERLLAVLADPHVGSFGVTAIALQLIAKLVLLQQLLGHRAFIPLLLIPFAARIGPLLWSRILPSLHAGLGDIFHSAARSWHLWLWGLIGLALSPLSPSLFAAPFALLIWAAWIKRRIGGISGDGHGAGIELCETLLLLAAVIWANIP